LINLLSTTLILCGGTIKDSQDGLFAEMLIGHLSPKWDRSQAKTDTWDVKLASFLNSKRIHIPML